MTHSKVTVTYSKLYQRLRYYYANQNIKMYKWRMGDYYLVKDSNIIDSFGNIYERSVQLGVIKDYEIYLAPNGDSYCKINLDGEVKSI